jgi:hypothetical protein
MRRRSFISLSALSAVPFVARAEDDAAETDWYETVNTEALTLISRNSNRNSAWKAEEFLERLRQPRVSLSAEGGTVLIV